MGVDRVSCTRTGAPICVPWLLISSPRAPRRVNCSEPPADDDASTHLPVTLLCVRAPLLPRLHLPPAATPTLHHPHRHRSRANTTPNTPNTNKRSALQLAHLRHWRCWVPAPSALHHLHGTALHCTATVLRRPLLRAPTAFHLPRARLEGDHGCHQEEDGDAGYRGRHQICLRRVLV